jgi:hypothetical protein
LGDANNLGSSERQEAVHECDAYVAFGGLAVRGLCGVVYIKGLQAQQLCLDHASYSCRQANANSPQIPLIGLVSGSKNAAPIDQSGGTVDIAIDVPFASGRRVGGEHRSEPRPREPHGFVADLDTALMEQVFDISERQREPDE